MPVRHRDGEISISNQGRARDLPASWSTGLPLRLALSFAGASTGRELSLTAEAGQRVAVHPFLHGPDATEHTVRATVATSTTR